MTGTILFACVAKLFASNCWKGARWFSKLALLPVQLLKRAAMQAKTPELTLTYLDVRYSSREMPTEAQLTKG